MQDWLIGERTSLYVATLLIVFLLVAASEALWPVRAARPSATRWFGNIGLYALNAWLGAMAAKLAAANQPFGSGVSLAAAPLDRIDPTGIAGVWAVMILSLILLDFTGYLIHRLYHALPFLWRLHAVHHSDKDVDATTGIRHHPGEAVANALLYAAVVALAGIPPAAVILYQTLALGVQLAQHGNFRLPRKLDAILARVVLTPSMHRVHHSISPVEANRNFGTILCVWDRWFRTLAHSAANHTGRVEFGVDGLGDAKFQRLDWMLLTPLVTVGAASAARVARQAP